MTPPKLPPLCDLERKTLELLRDEFEGGGDEPIWPTFVVLARCLRITVPIVKGVVRSLRLRRLLTYGPTIDLNDGTPKGSGYFLTLHAQAVLDNPDMPT